MQLCFVHIVTHTSAVLTLSLANQASPELCKWTFYWWPSMAIGLNQAINCNWTATLPCCHRAVLDVSHMTRWKGSEISFCCPDFPFSSSWGKFCRYLLKYNKLHQLNREKDFVFLPIKVSRLKILQDAAAIPPTLFGGFSSIFLSLTLLLSHFPDLSNSALTIETKKTAPCSCSSCHCHLLKTGGGAPTETNHCAYLSL